MSSQNDLNCTNVKRKNDYKSIRPDPVIKEGEGKRKRIRINSDIDIDREVSKKTEQEKQRLKAEKKALKTGINRKRIRPNKEKVISFG